MDALIERINTAKNSNVELERLIADYMPFIKKTVNDTGDLRMEYDDRLSLAMLAFMNCVKQYDTGRGSFTAFTITCIRNRLIDESRKQARHTGKVISLTPEGEEDISGTIDEKASIDAYNQGLEKSSLSDEISVFSEQLSEYGVTFGELPAICPKHERARRQCISIGRFVAGNEEMRATLIRTRRLSQSSLAAQFGLSEKTIESHRKYIVTIVILLTGDYPFIRTFLPQYKEV